MTNVKRTSRTQVADNTKLKQQLKELKNCNKDLKAEVKRLTNQKKEMQRLLDSMEDFIRDYTDHISLEDALKITKKRKKSQPKKAAQDKLKEELRKTYGRKEEV